MPDSGYLTSSCGESGAIITQLCEQPTKTMRCGQPWDPTVRCGRVSVGFVCAVLVGLRPGLLAVELSVSNG